MEEENLEYNEFISKFPQTVQHMWLAELTSYKIGGLADLYIKAENILDIPKFVQIAQDLGIRYYLLGGGCNIIFSDKGFRGLVIHNKADKIEVQGNKIVAESGAMLGQVIAKARKHELGGIIKMIGLPGTIGGAIYGNAGAKGVEIGDFVENVKLFDKEFGVKEENHDYFQFSYRTSILKKTHEIVLSVSLSLPSLNAGDTAPEIVRFRIENQPKGNTAGSFFKNPTLNESAGFLIDKAGLKGLEKGDIRVSELHGNWLINNGNGTQEDVVSLAREIKNEVYRQFKISLEPENIIIDEYGNKVDI
ncbi:UDP-N-acetylmuramate dehydrogenase [bacterium]|nr:UDP-N-acetylmuramate dehydrogenase [bacterium]